MNDAQRKAMFAKKEEWHKSERIGQDLRLEKKKAETKLQNLKLQLKTRDKESTLLFRKYDKDLIHNSRI